jgi:MFS family permease
LGKLSDRIGFKGTIIIGFTLFTVVYTGMALSHTLYLFCVFFFLYGLYAAATESVAKAWISNVTDTNETATAIGTYTGFQSIASMIASSFAGWLWITFGAPVTFLFSAGMTILIIVYFLFSVPRLKHH